MKMRLHLYSALWFVFFLVIITASPANAVIRIMPLGDSITRGTLLGSDDPDYQVSYRLELWDLLVTNGYDVDFVGSLNNGSAVFADSQHEGHGGWTADEIVNGRPGEGKLRDWLIAEPEQPSIVLLHIGTNDIDDQAPDGIVTEVSQILDEIYQYGSDYGVNITVILALIINRLNYVCSNPSTTTTFNDDLYDMALDRINNLGDRIEIVDMECGADIDYRQQPVGDMLENVHPFETGYIKMADLWYSGFQAIQPVADAGANQSVHEFDSVTLDGSNSSDHFGAAVSYQWEQTPVSTVVLSDSQSAMPTFTAPEVGPSGDTLTFRLTVTDPSGLEATDTTNVNVSNDNCPNDPNKTEPGACGCGIADTDSDGDGTVDCNDGCPNDPNKIQPGICGCGTADTDSDGDGTVDCMAKAPGVGTTAASDGGGGGCFIATAANGSLLEPHVKILRDFRDSFMLVNVLGKGFVRLYYTYSPPIAGFIAKHGSLKAMVRIVLLPVVSFSWIALKIGPLSTVALMLIFISCFVGLVWFKRRYKK